MSKLFFFSFIIFTILAGSSQAQEITTLNEKKDIVYALAVIDTSRILALSKYKIRYWDLRNKEIVGQYLSGNELTCMDVSDRGDIIALGDKAGTVRIISVNDNKDLYNKKVSPPEPITGISLDSRGKKVAVTFLSGRIGVFSTNPETEWIFKGHDKAALCLDFSEDGRFLVSGGAEGYVKFWDIQLKKEFKQIKTHKSQIRKIMWIKKDTEIISGGDDGDIHVLKVEIIGDPTKDPEIKTIKRKGRITGLDYDKKTGGILSCTLDGMIRLNFNLGIYMKKLSTPLFDVKFIPENSVFFSMAAGTNGRGVVILNSKGLKLTH